ncbi:MAG TPA: hypothetical protein VGM88_23180 [Kofleriaceae bacterium]
MDRQELDALLVGSLYGELSPAEQARLDAHLESHPSDRTALSDMSRARDAVRQSRLLEQQLDPPQSISALLMQEAARRAPKPAAEGWFQKFMRSFVAHPAMAAAATLVLVVGVAGTVWLRTGSPGLVETGRPADLAKGAPAPTAVPEAPAPGGPPDNAIPASPAATPPPVASDPQAQETAQLGKQADLAQKGAVVLGNGSAAVDMPPKSKLDETRGYKVALEEREPAPKDLAMVPTHRAAKGGAAGGGAAPSNGDGDRLRAADESTTIALDGLRDDVAKNNADFEKTGAPPPRPAMHTAAPAPTPTTPAPASAATPSRVAVAAPPAAEPIAAHADEGGAAAEDAKLVALADQKFAQLRKYVAAGQCPDAARVAREIQKIAPAYYTKNVQDLRELKSCAPYMNQMREQQIDHAPAPSSPAKAEDSRH